MPLPSALPLCHRNLLAGGAAADRAREPGSRRCLPSPAELQPGCVGGRVGVGGGRVSADEGTIDVPGGRVWYRSVGEGAAPLLCLHGRPGFTHYYLASLEALGARPRLLFYDQRRCA